MRGGRVGGRGPIRCYNCDQEGHVAREYPLPKIPLCSQCRVNTHATEDCLELIKRWEERARQRGVNLVNAEPRIVEAQAMQNVAIVTRGGKRTGEDTQNIGPINLIKTTSPKPFFRPDRQKQYFKEVVETFSQIGGSKGFDLPQPTVEKENQAYTSTMIEEWF